MQGSLAVNGKTVQRAFQPAKAKATQPKRSVAVQAQNDSTNRRAMLTGLLGASLLASGSAQAEPFLASSGAKGLLAEEEEFLFNLRREKEGEARARLQAEKVQLEEEARKSSEGKLCATPFGVDIVGITEAIALVGALVGGITARQRKEELERLNEQLRKINLSLRQQARAGTVYAPGLTYMPPIGGGATELNGNGNGLLTATATLAAPPRPFVKPAAPVPVSPASTTPSPSKQVTTTLLSMEEDEMSAEQVQCRDSLKQGKRLLKEKNGAAAMVRFEKALMLSKALGDKVQERRAMRGLAASARLQGQYKTAIKHLERVLDISREMKEFTGDADAYGTIADCYTDMGEFEKAAQFYDKYIETMGRDGPV